jgi:exosortase
LANLSQEGEKRPRSLVLAVLLLAGFVAVFHQVMAGLVRAWGSDPNSSHGFIIPFISAYFVWSKKEKLRAVGIRNSDWGLLLILGGLGLFMVSRLAQAATYQSISMLVVAAGILIFLYGWPLFNELLFPFLYLFFMIPVPRELYDAVAVPLKFLVSKYAVAVLQAFGVTVLQDGNIIRLPGAVLEVADACSGIRSLVSLIALAVAYAAVSQRGAVRKVLLVVFAVPIAIVVNGLRVIVTCLLAGRYGQQVAEGFLHEFAGLFIFTAAIALLLLAGQLLNRMSFGREH